MSKSSRSSQSKTGKQSNKETHRKEDGSNEGVVIGAIISAVAIITAAVIAYFSNVAPTALTIEATQTAEARLTTVAMNATEAAKLTQTQAAYVSMTAFSGTRTALAVEAENERLSISASQTADVLVAFQLFGTQTAVVQAIPTPTEIKPVRYEHIVAVGETLKDISKRYFVLDIYADSIGRANCNLSPAAGDKLIIRYIYVQTGDTVENIATRFGGSPKFLRSINNLSQEVVYPPVGQLFILAGSCGN